MKRDQYNALISWKNSKNRKPLIFHGARQVGKTYLLKEFGKKEYQSCVYLNFETDGRLGSFFSNLLDPKIILENISAYTAQKIDPEKTLLIFDEIQESPAALNSLKYFQEQANQYHIIAAGSLLGVKLVHSKGFPVGKVNFLHLYALSFFEFLDAIGKSNLREFLENIKILKPIPEPFHAELLALLKKYMFIGGMPEVVAEYIKTEDLLSVVQVQQEILKAYAFDFAKHAPKEEVIKINLIWESIPNQLAKENKKFIYGAIRKSARGREYESAIQWLIEAGLIYKSCNLNVPKRPLAGYANKNIFKIFLLDVGLLAAMNNIPPRLAVEQDTLFSEFYGAFTENFIAQEMVQKQPLYYWTSEGIAEVDFIIEQDAHVFPLEVKAGFSNKKKSLLIYGEKYQPKTLLRTSLMNLRMDGNICNIPIYLVSRISDFIF